MGALCAWGVALLFYAAYQLGWVRGHAEASRWHRRMNRDVRGLRYGPYDFKTVADSLDKTNKLIEIDRAARPPRP